MLQIFGVVSQMFQYYWPMVALGSRQWGTHEGEYGFDCGGSNIYIFLSAMIYVLHKNGWVSLNHFIKQRDNGFTGRIGWYHMPQFTKQFNVIEEHYVIFYDKVCN